MSTSGLRTVPCIRQRDAICVYSSTSILFVSFTSLLFPVSDVFFPQMPMYVLVISQPCSSRKKLMHFPASVFAHEQSSTSLKRCALRIPSLESGPVQSRRSI